MSKRRGGGVKSTEVMLKCHILNMFVSGSVNMSQLRYRRSCIFSEVEDNFILSLVLFVHYIIANGG